MFILFAVLPVFHGVEFFAGLSPHPSPLCAFAKPILFSLQEGRLIFPPVFAGVLAMIALLSIAGNKLFCGWVCPIGALQEIVYLCFPRLKKLRIPFAAANSVRIGLLVLFVPLLLGLRYVYLWLFQSLRDTALARGDGFLDAVCLGSNNDSRGCISLPVPPFLSHHLPHRSVNVVPGAHLDSKNPSAQRNV